MRPSYEYTLIISYHLFIPIQYYWIQSREYHSHHSLLISFISYFHLYLHSHIISILFISHHPSTSLCYHFINSYLLTSIASGSYILIMISKIELTELRNTLHEWFPCKECWNGWFNKTWRRKCSDSVFRKAWRIQDESEFEERNKGKGVMYRENNTVFMKPWFVNDIAEGEFTERDR